MCGIFASGRSFFPSFLICFPSAALALDVARFLVLELFPPFLAVVNFMWRDWVWTSIMGVGDSYSSNSLSGCEHLHSGGR